MEVNKQSLINPTKNDLSLICKTCLSHGRKLFFVEELSMKSYCKDLQLSLKDQVCWECKTIMSKFLVFTRRALRAQTLFTRWIKDTKNNPLPTLSNLTTFSPYNLTCTGNSNADMKKYIVVKLEPVDVDLNVKSEITENYEYTDSNQSVDNEEMDIESKITVQTDIEDLKQTIGIENNKPPVKEQSQAKKLCVEVCNDNNITSASSKMDLSSSQMISEDRSHTRSGPADGETTDSDVESRIMNLFTLKEMTHIEMLIARNKMKAEKKFKSSPFKCRMCIREFSSIRSLDKHNKKHGADAGKFMCDVCEQRFVDESLLRFHEKAHTRVYVCPNCTKEFPSTASALRHYDGCNTKQMTVYKCNLCEEQFTTIPQLRRHKRQAHGQAAICDLCGKHFADKFHIVKHLRIHSDDVSMFECKICNKKYRWKGGLTTHMRVHDKTNDDSVYCAVCNSHFKNIYSYKHHLENNLKHVKNQDMKFPCPHCEKRFNSNIYRKYHIESVHSDEMNYTCSTCERKFKTRKSLREHVRHTHEGYSRPRNNMCNMCGRTFMTKIHLKQHMNSHTGTRPYVCTTCGASFSYSAAFYIHKTRHKRCRAMLEQKTSAEVRARSAGEQTDK